MGEIADAMLNGTFCQDCGEYIGSGNGYPASCGCCSDDEKELLPYYKKRQQSEKRDKKCPLCEAWFVGEQGLINHLRQTHQCIKCEYCNEISEHWFELKARSKNYKRKTMVFCEDCIKNAKYIFRILSEKVKTGDFENSELLEENK